MQEFKHFDYGPQPQDRPIDHATLLADPEWSDKDHPQLEAELGESIVAALGSLTTRLMIDPDSMLGENHIVFSSEVASKDDSFIIIVPTSVVETSGMDSRSLVAWHERLEDSKEDKPMTFEIEDPSSIVEGEPEKLLKIWFDGTHYGLTRWGRNFNYTTETGKSVPAYAWDQHKIWDYNAEKRNQRTAERDNIINSASNLIFEVDSGADYERVAQALCTTGLLFDEAFIYRPRGHLSESGRDRDSVTHREILFEHSLGSRGERGPKDNFTMLIDATEGITDETQLALIRYWFVTEGQRELYLSQDDNPTTLEHVESHLWEKIEETDGAGNWDGSQTRMYLQDVLESEAERYTQSFTEYYKGHRFQHSESRTALLATTQYPELNQDSQIADIALAVALEDNSPPDPLLEKLREMQRLVEDYDEAGDDDEKIQYIQQQHAQAAGEVEESYDGYYVTIEGAAGRASRKIQEELGIDDDFDTRAMLIEGILLARQVASLADAA